MIMIDDGEAKKTLFEILSRTDADGKLDEASFELLQHTIDRMDVVSPVQNPIEQPDKVDGRWMTLFASFGVRHSAGKPRVRPTTLDLLSFNALPAVPIMVSEMYQEIDSGSLAYNNIVDFKTADGNASGSVVVTGTYSRDDDNLKRYHVVFKRAHVVMGSMCSADIRLALGVEPDAQVDGAFKVAKIYSDIVYLDDEIRVNKGNMGGSYVLKRCVEQCQSI